MTEQNEKSLISIIMTWWKELDHLKGDRAELKRCAKLDDIQLFPGFYNLKNRIAEGTSEKIKNEELALIVGVLVHIKTAIESGDKLKSIAALMGKGKEGEQVVKPLRFRRLLQATAPEDLFRKLVRVLPLIEQKAYLPTLIKDLQFWNETTRRRWAEAYYSK